MAKKRKSSTEPSGAGWTLEDCGPEFVEMRATELGIKGKGEARTAALSARLSDPAWISQQLRELSAFELIVLEALIDLGGTCEIGMLWDEACRRAQVEREFHECEVERAIAQTGAQLSGPRDIGIATVLRPCSVPLQHLLTDISVAPITGPLPAAAQEVALQVRNTIVAACRLAHRKVRATKNGAPSKTNQRRFEADVATSDASLWTLLDAACDWQLTTADVSGALVPNREVVTAVSRGVLPQHARATGLDLAALLKGGPVPVERVIRQLQRAEFEAQGNGPSGYVELPKSWVLAGSVRAARALRNYPDLWVGEVDGVLAVAAPRPAGSGEGHVLANFEVMLAPETSLDVVTVVALAAELVRLDQIATFRLTPASVRAAVVHGVELAEILAALDDVGTRAVPDNVRQSVREWATTVSTARIIRDRVIVVPAAAGDRLLAESRTCQLFEGLAPGVLRVADSVTEAKLAGFLDDVGVAVVPDVVAPPPPSGRGAVAPPSGPPPSVAPDPAAVARVQAALAKREFPPLVHAHVGNPDVNAATTDSDDPGGPSFDAPPGVPQATFNRELAAVRAELKRWHRKLRPKARGKIKLPLLLNQPGAILELVLVHASARARILRRATKVDQLSRLARAALLHGHIAFTDHVEEQPPHPREFASLAPRAVRSALSQSIDMEARCYLLLKTGGSSVVTPALRIQAIVPRGSDVVVQATTAASGDDHAFALTSIASVLFADDEDDDDTMSLHDLERLIGRF